MNTEEEAQRVNELIAVSLGYSEVAPADMPVMWVDESGQIIGTDLPDWYHNLNEHEGTTIKKLREEYNLIIKFFFESDFILCEIHHEDYEDEAQSNFWDGKGPTMLASFCYAYLKTLEG